MVMKGYIEYQLPAEQKTDKLERPDVDQRSMFDTADDLRIGAMAFRDNGSKTECVEYEAKCGLTDDGKFTAWEAAMIPKVLIANFAWHVNP